METEIGGAATLDKHLVNEAACRVAIRQSEPVPLRVKDKHWALIAGENTACAGRQAAIKNTRMFQLVLEHLSKRRRTVDRATRPCAHEYVKVIIRRHVPAWLAEAGAHMFNGFCRLGVRKRCRGELRQ